MEKRLTVEDSEVRRLGTEALTAEFGEEERVC